MFFGFAALIFFFAGGWRILALQVEMAKVVPQKLLQALLEGNEEAWNTFVFDVEKDKALTPELEDHKDKAKAVLAAGGAWNCRGWNTSIASRKLWNSIRVSLVSNEGK